MRIAIAADHGGYDMKQTLIARLRQAGHAVTDFGAATLDPGDDYPDSVIPLARAVAAGEFDRGIVICGSGVGASVAANKEGDPGRFVPRPLFRPPGGRGRRHEHPLPGRARHGYRGRLGSRPDLPRGDLQRRRATPAAPGQGGPTRAFSFDERVTVKPSLTAPASGTLKPPRRIPRGPRSVGILRPAVRSDIFIGPGRCDKERSSMLERSPDDSMSSSAPHRSRYRAG